MIPSWLRQIVRGEAHFNIIGRFRLWATISGVVLLLSLVGLFGRHLNLSIDFKGGTAFTVPLQREVTVPDAESALSEFNLSDVRPQITTAASGQKEMFVRTPHIADRDKLAKVQQKLATLAGLSSVNDVSLTDVGPTWGKQISSKALRGLIVFLVLVTIYISLRFEPKMAVGALAALFHDLLATAGIYALFGIPVTPATVIALLTLLGFSLYDTVVVFDKVRENAAAMATTGRIPYTDVVNNSVNQVLMRSINTSLSVLLPIAALLFVGVILFHATTLEDLAVALFIGTIVGTYSSVFIASPILAVLKEREPRYRALRARLAGEGGRPAARPPREPKPASVQEAEEVEEVDEAEVYAARVRKQYEGPMRVHRPPPRPRKSKKKRKRR
jgi:preprotein translocase subunit SecF